MPTGIIIQFVGKLGDDRIDITGLELDNICSVLAYPLIEGGNGGQPSDEGNADDGTKGSGGGGARNQQIWARYSGAGGTGFLKVSWS